MLFIPNIIQIWPVVLEKKIFKDFSFGCHGNQSSSWNGTILVNFIGDHLRDICAKFDHFLSSSFREEDV